MPLFSAKLDYALRALVDLAQQQPDVACQSREIAQRQDIRGPYLDQILAVLKREGLVRSIRGAGGGYTLAVNAHKITVGRVVRAIVGERLLIGSDQPGVSPECVGSAWVIRQFEERIEQYLSEEMGRTTIADLAADQRRMQDSFSYMPGF